MGIPPARVAIDTRKKPGYWAKLTSPDATPVLKRHVLVMIVVGWSGAVRKSHSILTSFRFNT